MKKRRILQSIICIVLILAGSVLVYANESTKPIFEFDYMGSHIQTYASYSVVDDKPCNTHRYYVKSGNLVLIDKELNANPRDIFIHFADEKSYIAVATKDGKMVSLGTEDLCAKLQDFKNEGIRSLADNIYSNSTTMYFEYKNGATVAYDCITGKIINKTPATEKNNAADFFSDYFADMFERSTEGGIDTSGAKAQSIVLTLENSGSSLEHLMDAGAFDTVESDFQEGGHTVIDYSGKTQHHGSVTVNDTDGSMIIDGISTADGSLQGDGATVDVDIVYDFKEDEAYKKLMDSKAKKLSDEQLDTVRELFAGIARGDVSADEINAVINAITSQNHDAAKIEWINSEDGSTRSVDVSSIAEIKNSRTKKKITETFNIIETNRDKAISNSLSQNSSAGALRDVGSMIEERKQQRKKEGYLVPDSSNRYLAAYNANGEKYEIFNLDNVLYYPENLESEVEKLGIEKANDINKILSSHKDTDTQRGVRIFSVIMGLIILSVVLILISVRKIGKKDKSIEIKTV